MIRLIDADALKRRLIKRREEIASERRYGWEWEYNGLNCAILLTGCEAVENPIRPEPHWIPVTERLPEEERECWITPKTTSKVYRGVFTRHYGECHRTGFICDDGFMWLNTALAWMYCELPEPYKGVTE